MVRNNHVIPNGHFHKNWQFRVKQWFNQPMKKRRRHNIRTRKLTKSAPKPIKILRPTVHAPSVRYNTKLRTGRGFTLQELKQAGININYAKTIGIAVDHRRRNRCFESIARNAQRLKNYQGKLILFPRKEQSVVKMDNGKFLNKIEKTVIKVKGRRATNEEKTFEAYVTLRKARCDAKYAGIRTMRKLPKVETLDGNKIV